MDAVGSLLGGPKRILRTGREKEDSPIVKLTAPEFMHPTARFLVDPGSDVYLMKIKALKGAIIVGNNPIGITGITAEIVDPFGSVNLTILNKLIEFQVIGNDFPISTDGILGRPYLREEQANMSFRHNTLVAISNPKHLYHSLIGNQ